MEHSKCFVFINRLIKERENANESYSLEISVCEIYVGYIKDLLAPPEKVCNSIIFILFMIVQCVTNIVLHLCYIYVLSFLIQLSRRVSSYRMSQKMLPLLKFIASRVVKGSE